jgi:predicted metal-dependent phosphoesterase TrpH
LDLFCNSGNTALPVGSAILGLSNLGSVVGNAGLGLATAGTIARQFQKLSAQGKLDKVLRTIEGLEPEIAKKVIEKLPPKTRDYILANIATNASSR